MTAATVARRELASFFRLPVGWVVIALFLLFSAFTFWRVAVTPGEVASLRLFFQTTAFLLIVIAPAVSMRLISEEIRAGTLESLMTSPAADLSVVGGKFLGAAGFLVAMLLPTLVYVVLLCVLAEPAPDPGPILAGYLSVLLVGLLYLSVGLLASTMTASQTLAFLGTFLFLLLFLLSPGLVSPYLPAPLDEWLLGLSVQRRVDDFAKGVLDTSHVVYFLSLTLWFLLLAWVSLGSRRWR